MYFSIQTILAILSCVSICDSRIWDFAFSNDGPPANFFNKKNKFVGQSVSMVKKICRLAGKRCRTFAVPRAECWDDTVKPGVSRILDSKKYEICANLVVSPDRLINYRFSSQNIYDIPDPVIIARPGIKLKDLKKCNNFVMAFPMLTALNRGCLLSAGFFVKKENVLPVEAIGSISDAVSEIVDKVRNGKADIGIVITRFLSDADKGMVIGESPCLNELIGLNMMVNQNTKVSDNFLSWWTPTLKNFICSGRPYKKFCSQMKRRFNDNPMCFKPGVDVDCNGNGLPPPKPMPKQIDPCA